MAPQDSLPSAGDRKSTRLNSSHGYISYAVFCLKKKKIPQHRSDVPPTLARGVDPARANDPAERFRTAAALSPALVEALPTAAPDRVPMHSPVLPGWLTCVGARGGECWSAPCGRALCASCRAGGKSCGAATRASPAGRWGGATATIGAG